MSSAPAEQKSEGTSAGGGGNKPVLILTLVNLVGTLAMIGILYVSFQREKKAVSVEDINAQSEVAAHGEAAGHGEAKAEGHGEAAKKKPVEGVRMVTLEPFTVNLSTPGSTTAKLVRVNVSIEMPNEDSEAEVNAKMPQVRNAIIDLINSKRPSDLATVDGRDYLKEEIKTALNTFLVSGKVRGIFFTNFALSG